MVTKSTLNDENIEVGDYLFICYLEDMNVKMRIESYQNT